MSGKAWPHRHEVYITIDGDGDAKIAYGEEWAYALRRTRPWWRPWWTGDSVEEFGQRIEAKAREVIARHDARARQGNASDVANAVASRLNSELAQRETKPDLASEWVSGHRVDPDGKRTSVRGRP